MSQLIAIIEDWLAAGKCRECGYHKKCSGCDRCADHCTCEEEHHNDTLQN